MELDNLHDKNFLNELYRLTKGDTAAQVSMYEVGAALGLARNEAGSLAENLIVDGLVELKTLAGGIGITDSGLASLGHVSPAASPISTFSKGPIANEQDREMMSVLLRLIKDGLSGRSIAYDRLEEIVIDVKTVEVHLLSPKPKIPVLRELIRSLHDALAAAGIMETAAHLQAAVD